MYAYTYNELMSLLQKQLLDDRIESVVLRVDEFKKQLETMHGNLASSSEKMQDLHEKMRMLKELFKRIDQVEVRLGSLHQYASSTILFITKICHSPSVKMFSCVLMIS